MDTEQPLRLCPLIAFDRIVGGKYKLRILWQLERGIHRYGQLRASLMKGSLGQGITARVLSRELKELQARGLIERKQYDQVPPRVEYRLTDRGKGLLSIIDAIVRWGRTGEHELILGLRDQPLSV